MNFYRNLSVFGKIFGVSILILMFSGLVALFSYYQISALKERDDVRRLEISMLEARRSEKDFFARKNMKYAALVNKRVSEFLSIMEAHKDNSKSSQLVEAMNEYMKYFNLVASKLQQRGFDENSGAEGDLRSSVHAVEKIVKEAKQNNLLIEMLSARRSEKDFFLRGKQKYIDKVHKAVISLIEDTKNSKLSEQNKSKIIELAGQYETKFKLAAQLIMEQVDLTETLRQAVHKVEPLLEEIVGQKEQKAANYNTASTGVLIFSVVMGLGLALLLSRIITKPISKLNKKAIEVASGNFDVSVDINQNDEIGSLSKSFNKMAQNIKKGREELEAEKANIERKVEEAVYEIETQKLYLANSVDIILSEMEKFANGDLEVNLIPEKQDDEIGKLFLGFNKAVLNIKNMIIAVSESIRATASATNEISSSTEEMSAGAQEQSAQTTEVAGAIEEMTSTILLTTNHANSAAESSKRAGEIAHVGGRVVEETVMGMNRIADVVNSAVLTVTELGKSSDLIGQIVQVIDDIADQTNLLALNAAIEAARAGEQGRGFAVVADEVRKLAERTTKATKEIAAMIKRIQNDTGGAVESIKQGTQEVQNGKELADKAGKTLVEIISATDQVKQIITQVAAASEEQSATAEQISKNVAGISTITEQSANGVQQIANAAEDLNRLTVSLQDLISRFRVRAIDGDASFARNKEMSGYSVRHNGKLIPN